MYQQIKPTEVFRERELALMKEAENRRVLLGRRLRARGTPKTRSTIAAVVVGFLAALVVASLLLAASSSPAYAAGTTFTVNSTADTDDATPDGACDSCTLREAIQEANANNDPAQVDRIAFGIPGTGVKTILPSAPLPTITEPLVINGYSQPGSSANTQARGTNAKPLVQISGTNQIEFFDGLKVSASNSVVKGLVINRFAEQDAISIRPQISAGAVTNVRIEGNFLGTDPSGTLARGSDIGVAIFGASNNTIGGTSLASRNLISGNKFEGVLINGDNATSGSTDNNEVRGNLIGTQKDGIKALGNGFNGVEVFGDAQGNSILSNSIFSNGGLGIDLGFGGPTANDPGDTDTGSNDLQNKPSLGSAKTISGKTTIKGTLNSRPGATYTIQFFSNPSGADEGRTFIGQKTGLSVNKSGNASFTFSPATKVAVGQTVTATATNEFTGDTSEFSGTRTVASS